MVSPCLSDTLKHKCQCDHTGRTWRKFAELREHTLAKEMESNAIRQSRIQHTTLDRPTYLRKRYTRPDNDKRVVPAERHSERPHLTAIAQEALVPVKRSRQQTRSPPRESIRPGPIRAAAARPSHVRERRENHALGETPWPHASSTAT